jgi:S-adenosyl-L-methionine hydrolase (adenosine-forming)
MALRSGGWSRISWHRSGEAIRAVEKVSVESAVPGRISFLSDYGLEDEFVGIVHAVIDRVAPGTRVIDVTHGIPPYDVKAAAMTLWRTAPWLVPGVIMAVVDPGVGTNRRAVALEVASAGAYFVGPDNGMLVPGAFRLGRVTAAVRLDRTMSSLTSAQAGQVGGTFDGRDVFAPAAARLASGATFSDLGEAVDPSTLLGSELEAPDLRSERGEIVCTATWVDRFGNVQLNVSASDLLEFGSPSSVTAVLPVSPGDFQALRIVAAYGELRPDEPGLVIDSYGMVSLALREASASTRLGLVPGDQVRLQVFKRGSANRLPPAP